MSALILLSLMAVGLKSSVDMGLNLTQSYYNNAWQGDETGSITWAGIINMTFGRPLGEKIDFSNSTELAYGQTYSQDSETEKWNPPQKSTDRIENEAFCRFTMGWLVDPFISLRISSQFRDDASEIYLNPVTLTQALGLARTLLKNDDAEVNSRLGLAFRESFDRAKNIENRREGGLEMVIEAGKSFSKTAKYSGKLRVFQALYKLQTDELQDDSWRTPDFDYQNTVSVSLSKYIALNFVLELVYDRDQINVIQVRENFAIGLNYKIF